MIEVIMAFCLMVAYCMCMMFAGKMYSSLNKYDKDFKSAKIGLVVAMTFYTFLALSGLYVLF